MRFRVPIFRIVVLCVVIGIIVAFVNLVSWTPQTEPCVCDCSGAVARKEAELKLHYEYEMSLNKGKAAGEFDTDDGGNGKAPRVSQKDSNAEGDEIGKGDGETGESSHLLAVVVPFRNRYEEMQEFVPHIHRFLNRQNVRHEIWIINQEDTHRCEHVCACGQGSV